MHLPDDVLCRVSKRIINEVRGVSRVVYDISEPPAVPSCPCHLQSHACVR
ncbi:hypothetical protein [Luteimonas sp. 3794]